MGRLMGRTETMLSLGKLTHVFRHDRLSSLLGNHERVSTLGVWPEGTSDHGATTSMYHRDPDRAEFELDLLLESIAGMGR
jgi:hypothetical protein